MVGKVTGMEGRWEKSMAQNSETGWWPSKHTLRWQVSIFLCNLPVFLLDSHMCVYVSLRAFGVFDSLLPQPKVCWVIYYWASFGGSILYGGDCLHPQDSEPVGEYVVYVPPPSTTELPLKVHVPFSPSATGQDC